MATPDEADIAIVGCGAAGLMAAVWAGRRLAGRGRVVALDGAKKIGVKILVAGGGRCNVTHHAVSADDFAGSSRTAIRRVLQRFDVDRTREFFAQLGVELKREPTGKLFPTTDNAHTVLDALTNAARDAGAELRYPTRVQGVQRHADGFTLTGDRGSLHARRVVIATGGKALPRSGSDGAGYAIVRALGHTVSRRIVPALVPLRLEDGCALRERSGVATHTRIELRSATGKRLHAFEGSTLCTHFGLSGPAPMNISRFWTHAAGDDPGTHLVIDWLPALDREALDRSLRELGRRTVGRWLGEHIPERLAATLCRAAGVDPAQRGAELTRHERRSLVDTIGQMPLPVVGDRGFTHAEVTAGGVPLSELSVKTMASNRCEGLHLCGEICDVDGRIGGFNFQWAWASGHIAGAAAADALADAAAKQPTANRAHAG
jgi:hypothetical protein